MKKSSIITILAAGMLSMASCGNEENITATVDNKFEPIAFSAAELSAADDAQGFAFSLFCAQSESRPGDNVIISPASAAMCLSLLANGAQGETLDEICQTLGVAHGDLDALNNYNRHLLNGLPGTDKTATLTMANAIFTKGSTLLSGEYKASVAECLDASCLDFGENPTAAVNDWVSRKTGGSIQAIAEPGEMDLCVLAVLNAMHFKGVWSEPFDAELSRPGSFTNADGVQSEAVFMHNTLPLAMAENEWFTLASLPFGNGAYSMALLLPRPGKDIDQCVERLDADLWRDLVDSTSGTVCALSIPRLALGVRSDLTQALKLCGISKAFGTEADFGRMSDHQLYAGTVRQGCSLSMDEKGVVMAAATATGLLTANVDVAQCEFRLDRPFLFALTEKSSGAILFMGKVCKLD